jgi:hypothetical protein
MAVAACTPMRTSEAKSWCPAMFRQHPLDRHGAGEGGSSVIEGHEEPVAGVVDHLSSVGGEEGA